MPAQVPEPPASCQWPFQHPPCLPAASPAPLTPTPPCGLEEGVWGLAGGSLDPGQGHAVLPEPQVHPEGSHILRSAVVS